MNSKTRIATKSLLLGAFAVLSFDKVISECGVAGACKATDKDEDAVYDGNNTHLYYKCFRGANNKKFVEIYDPENGTHIKGVACRKKKKSINQTGPWTVTATECDESEKAADKSASCGGTEPSE